MLNIFNDTDDIEVGQVYYIPEKETGGIYEGSENKGSRPCVVYELTDEGCKFISLTSKSTYSYPGTLLSNKRYVRKDSKIFMLSFEDMKFIDYKETLTEEDMRIIENYL